MTFTEAKLTMSSIGISLHKQDGEYRVAFKGTRRDDTYSEAYFTSDLADAVTTGRAIALNLMPAFKSPFKCLFCGEVYEYGDVNHSHN